MKKYLFLTVILLMVNTLNLFAQSKSEAYAIYIVEFSNLAIEHQAKYKIPASITLAQGLLESGAGMSHLAKQGNNHFGINCGSSWYGETMRADDDTRNECFRKYKSAKESYEDHSRFLMTKHRYMHLFKLNPSDYKAWAYGLKNAGYATDRQYAQKLIRIIEDFDLHKYDVGERADIHKMVSVENKKNYVWNTTGTPVTLTGHTVYRSNRVKCIVTELGDSFDAIANEFRISKKKLLKYNDLTKDRKLQPKTIVFLSKKKKRAEKKYLYHKVEKGETMYSISQKYAIRLQSLYDLNNMPYTQAPVVEQILVLR